MRVQEEFDSSRETLVASYDAFYETTGELRDTDAFYRWVLKKLDPAPTRRLLDVACGEGHLIKFARRRGVDGVGVDFSSNATSLARGIVAADVIVVADGETLPFADECFDYVTNLGSLEHFTNPLMGVRETRRVLRPSGRAALLLPNSYYLVDIVWHVWRTGYGASHRQIVERFATFREWADLLEQGGLKVNKTYKYNLCFPRSLSDWRWYMHHPRKLLYLLVAPFVPFNLSYSFLYICAKSSCSE